MKAIGQGVAIRTGMVLAAGLGTRMRPLTDAVPKPLLRLAGRTLLDRALDGFAAAGIELAVVNLHYHGDQIERQLEGRTRPKIILSDERSELLETGGGVMKALAHFGGSPFLVQNADTVWSEAGGQSNLALAMNAFEPQTMAGLLLLARRDSSIGYNGRGDFELGSDGRLRRREQGSEAPYVFAGVSILNPELFDDIGRKAFSLNVIFDKAIAQRALFGTVLKGTWMHVGTPDALAEAEKFLNEGRRRTA